MQYLYSYLHFFSALLFLILGIIILIRDFNMRLNRACAGVMFCFFIWSMSTVWVHHPSTPEATARFIGNIAAIGWLSFPSVHALFAWFYTRREIKNPAKLFGILLLFLPPVVFVLVQWTQSAFVADFQHHSYGWFTPWEPKIWSVLYFIYCGGMNLAAFGLIFHYARKNDNKFIRRQSAVIIISGTISLTSGFLCNVIFSLITPEGFPSIGDITSLIWAGGLTYVAIRYNMLNITPFIAANRIIASMKDLLFLLDTHGNIISVNQAAQHVLRCRPDQITNRPFGELIRGGPAHRASITGPMLTQPEFTVETSLSCQSGPAVPVELSTSLIPGTGIVCVGHDISLQKQRTETLEDAKKQLESRVSQATEALQQTNRQLLSEIEEKKAAVEALEESEKRFRIIFECAPDGICLFDQHGGFLDGNNEALRIFGCAKKDAAAIAEKIAPAADETASEYHEVTLVKSDGTQLPVETVAHELEIGEKRLSICIVRDLSQRKKTEQEAEELRVALHHSQKMEAVGRLAGGIAHDFNNLLGGIMGYAELLQKRLPPHFASESEILEKIVNISKQAAERTFQLLAFARKGKYTVETISMHSIITEVTELMRFSINPKIALTFTPGADCALVSGDRSQLYSALLNLGVNARDALPNGGAINFSTHNVNGADLQFADVPADQLAGRYLEIIVEDNGSGMDETTAAQVFEPFFSTKPEGQGTGLGLPSVYGTVTQHGGFIQLQTQIGKGTAISLFLPLSENPVVSSATVAEVQVPNNGRNTTSILVVDDTQLIREMMVESLESEGHTVHACEDGNQAISWYRSNYATCGLVVLDYAMPDLNGKECFLAMKEINPSVKAIIASGYAVDGEIEKTLKAGACSFLQKPFNIDSLLALVQQILSDA